MGCTSLVKYKETIWSKIYTFVTIFKKKKQKKKTKKEKERKKRTKKNKTKDRDKSKLDNLVQNWTKLKIVISLS